MKCPRCGSEATNRFCSNCGAPAQEPFVYRPKSPNRSFQQFGASQQIPVKRPKSFLPLLLAGICLVILFFALGVAALFQIASRLAPSDGSRQTDGWFTEGYYEVGRNLDAGVYYLLAATENTGVTAEVTRGLFAYDDDYTRCFSSFGYIRLKSGQEVALSGGWMIEADDAPLPAPDDGWFSEGMYRVGRDLPAGEYFFRQNGGAFIDAATHTDCYGDPDSDADIGAVSVPGRAYLSVEDGQYLEVTDALFTPAEQALTPNKENGWYSPGMYLAGTDIPEGDYFFRTAEGCDLYVDGYLDSSGAVDSWKDTFAFRPFGYARLMEGIYYQLEEGYFTEADSAPVPVPSPDGYDEGMYLVGRDIPAGDYTLTPYDSAQDFAFYEILRDCQNEYEDLLDYGAITRSTKISVSDGQYIKTSGCSMGLALQSLCR